MSKNNKQDSWWWTVIGTAILLAYIVGNTYISYLESTTMRWP